MATETILVVDDDREIVKILRGYLEQAKFAVLTAYDGASALNILRRERPALLLLDVMLPDRDGWALTRQIRADAMLLTTPILMITAKVDDADKIVGLELGADDYITKPFNAREVVARVRAMLRRTQLDRQTGTEVYSSGDLRLDVFQRTLTLHGENVEVTPTEFKLLLKLMANPGHTFSREELLETAFGIGYERFGRTLDTHIANLRRKIEPDPKNPTCIETVYSVGYRFKREEGEKP
jgi:two-component system alkaline phosphatase synthesis response regulator PhoP